MDVQILSAPIVDSDVHLAKLPHLIAMALMVLSSFWLIGVRNICIEQD